MERFSLGLRNPKPNSHSQMNSSNDELLNNLGSIEGFNTSANGAFVPLSNDEFYDQHQSQLSVPFCDAIPRSSGPDFPIFDPLAHFFPSNNGCNNVNEHEVMVNSSSSISGTGFGVRNKNYSGKKRKRSNEKEMEKPRDVVHVRAKRGQATDSHSLAERLRREKINEKLRCLQDLVPGCYKTMGMAVMLDVIINYVRSLQNQIDFLSMKLSAASLYYDFNSSEAEAIETLQGTTGYEAPGMDKLVEGYNNAGISQFQTSWLPL